MARLAAFLVLTLVGCSERRWCAVDERYVDYRGCFAREAECNASVPPMLKDHLSCRRLTRPWCTTAGGTFDCFDAKGDCDARSSSIPGAAGCTKAWPSELAK